MCSERGKGIVGKTLLVLCLTSAVARAAEPRSPGGHALEFALFAGYTDFDSRIRFDDDSLLGVGASMGITSWLLLGVEFSQATVRDTKRAEWISTYTAAVRTRVEPWTGRRLSPGLSLGVSFFAFEENERSDALSEGLDLGASMGWALSPRWKLRGDGFLRLQTLRRTRVDANGRPMGGTEETGYLWSRLFRVGLSHVF